MRTGRIWSLLLIPWPLLAVAAWFMFHNPTAHGVELNGTSQVGDRTCLAPYDITLFHGENEYGGQEVGNPAYEKAQCDAAGHKSFTIGAVAGLAGVGSLIAALVLSEKRSPSAA